MQEFFGKGQIQDAIRIFFHRETQTRLAIAKRLSENAIFPSNYVIDVLAHENCIIVELNDVFLTILDLIHSRKAAKLLVSEFCLKNGGYK